MQRWNRGSQKGKHPVLVAFTTVETLSRRYGINSLLLLPFHCSSSHWDMSGGKRSWMNSGLFRWLPADLVRMVMTSYILCIFSMSNFGRAVTNSVSKIELKWGTVSFGNSSYYNKKKKYSLWLCNNKKKDWCDRTTTDAKAEKALFWIIVSSFWISLMSAMRRGSK